MRRLVLVLLLCSSCKKSHDEEADTPEPEVVDISMQLETPTTAKLSFRVLDAKKQPLVVNTPRVDVDVQDGRSTCSGFANAESVSFAEPDKRATAGIEFVGGCDRSTDFKDATVHVTVKSSGESFASGNTSLATLTVPHVGTTSSDVDAAIAKLAPIVHDLPRSGGQCSDAVVKLDETTPVESVELGELARLTGDPAGRSDTMIGSNLFGDLAGYRDHRVKDTAKLLERLQATKYLIVLRVDKLTHPELKSTHTFFAGQLEATATLVSLPDGKALCTYPVVARSSSSVKPDSTVDVLDRDLQGQINLAFRDSTKNAFPKIKIGAHTDSLADAH